VYYTFILQKPLQAGEMKNKSVGQFTRFPSHYGNICQPPIDDCCCQQSQGVNVISAV
jgi:hypothetical protein